jgi:hypothetical protein
MSVDGIARVRAVSDLPKKDLGLKWARVGGAYANRYLDPDNPKSARKPFFNPNVLREFDKFYTLKK